MTISVDESHLCFRGLCLVSDKDKAIKNEYETDGHVAAEVWKKHLKRLPEKGISYEPHHDFSICENNYADHLCNDCTANQRLCFHFTDSTIPLFLESEISSFLPSFVTVLASLCWPWSEI